ncbi:hypothetical protein SAMN02745181_0250 [Rubritalea squalenifaciens DSM 18772]|uniref:CDI immunity protein domain-containing protein n=2 Tax=Rubritalea TaxID=361050 RepID=A0A1M6BLG4_9BACT|nr:hypothetical protein [Rubritalea squalenifaciens]SHI49408.1 hypothetical protein SAMN02745181_0250 [Rubritalea squalenifaciens DSM 18772]
MKVIFDPQASLEFQYSVEPLNIAHKAALDAIRHYHSLDELFKFAHQGHGYGDSDGYFGITYSNDLDDYDRANDQCIPEGFVQVYAGYGDSYSEDYLITEAEYLNLLEQFFRLNERIDLADNLPY